MKGYSPDMLKDTLRAALALLAGIAFVVAGADAAKAARDYADTHYTSDMPCPR